MEPKKFWAKFKSLDSTIEFPTKLTVIIGPSGSGKTALVETFKILQNSRPHQATVGIEIWHWGCRTIYEVSRDKKTLISNCGSDGEEAVQEFLNNMVVIETIDWKAVRSLQSAKSKETRLLPDASNFIPFLYNAVNGTIPDSLVEALRYVFPPISDLQFVTEGDTLILKLTTENGITLTQATMPSGVLKTLILETVLMTHPTMLVIDEFENSLDPETQQFLMDEFRSHDIYALLTTNSETVLDYVKTPREVVMLRLDNGKTVAQRLGEEVKETLKREGLTLSELIYSGLLEPLVF